MPITLSHAEDLVIAHARGALERDDLAVLIGALDERIARRERFLVVGDALEVTAIAPAARKLVGEHRKANAVRARTLDLGLVIALRSPIVRGAITAISWIGGDFANLRAVDSRSEAARVAREVLGAHGAALGPRGTAALEGFVARPRG